MSRCNIKLCCRTCRANCFHAGKCGECKPYHRRSAIDRKYFIYEMVCWSSTSKATTGPRLRSVVTGEFLKKEPLAL